MPKQYYNSLTPKTYDDAISSISTPIAIYRKDNGDMKARALLVLFLNDVIQFFNVGKTMNPIQVAQTADLILEDYSYFNVEDFKLCFSLAKKGSFGSVYDRIDGQIILSWIDKYHNDRCSYCFDSNYKKHIGIKSDEKNASDFLSINANRMANL